MADSQLTPTFRLSFPSLFKASSFDDGASKFSATMLFAPGTDLSALKAAAKEAAIEKWGADNIPAGLRSPFRDGKDKEHLDGYEAGMIFIKASSSEDNPPDVRDNIKDENGEFAILLDPRKIYAGSYCRAVVQPFAYDKKGNKGVSFGLRVIQLVADGPSFGGGGAEMLKDLPPEQGSQAAPAAGEGDNFLK